MLLSPRKYKEVLVQNNSIVPRSVMVVVAHPDDMEFTAVAQ
jgi:hypothetical protein